MSSEVNSSSNNSNLKFIDINDIESDSNSLDDSNSSLDMSNISITNVIKNRENIGESKLTHIFEHYNGNTNAAKLRKLKEKREKLLIINKLLKNVSSYSTNPTGPLASTEYELVRVLLDYKVPYIQDLILIQNNAKASEQVHHSQFSVLPVSFTDLSNTTLKKFTPFLTVSRCDVGEKNLLKFTVYFFDIFNFQFTLKSSDDSKLQSLVLSGKSFFSHVCQSELSYVLKYYFPNPSNQMPTSYDFTDWLQKLNFYSILYMKRTYYFLLLFHECRTLVNQLQWISIISKIRSFIPFAKSLKDSLDILGDYLKNIDMRSELSFEQNCQSFELLPKEKQSSNEEKYSTLKSMGLLFPNLTTLKLQNEYGLCLDLNWFISFEDVSTAKINEPKSIITGVIYKGSDNYGLSFVEKDDKIIEQLIKRYGLFKGLKSYIDAVFDN